MIFAWLGAKAFGFVPRWALVLAGVALVAGLWVWALRMEKARKSSA